MKKILLGVTMTAIVCLCGCSSFSDKEYLYVEEYSPEEVEVSYQEKSVIENYSDLTDAINSMITNRQAAAQLQFNGYVGNINDDIAEVCWKAKSETALGAYMVDYISYDISRIVTYYQATIYVNYKRSAEQLQSIENIGANRLEQTVMQAVENTKDDLAMAIYTDVIDATDMENMVRNALMNIGSKSPVIPEVKVDMYSGNSLQCIFDVQFDYGVSKTELAEMQTRLTDATHLYSNIIKATDDYSIAVVGAGVMADRAIYDADAEAGTAYNSLVLGSGDSRAFAMGFSAITAEHGVDSIVVSGLRNNEIYYWNMVDIDGVWYHVDCLTAKGDNDDKIILLNDSEMIKNYRWNELDYPICDGSSFATKINLQEN